MVTGNALQRVFRIKFGQSCGTGFVIDVAGKEYLVTAKHVIEGFPATQAIEIFHNNIWIQVEGTLVGHSQAEIDISVLVLDRQLSPDWHLPLPADDKDIVFGQDVYFLGFPYNLFTDIGQNNRHYPIPFIKKAIVSSLTTDKSKTRIYYLDGHNNPGFSGGPVIFRPLGQTEFRVAAVISGYRYEDEPVYHAGQATPLAYRYNTGLIIGYGIYHAVELINANPIGLPVTIK